MNVQVLLRYHGLHSLQAGFKGAFSGGAFWRGESGQRDGTPFEAAAQGFWK